MNRQQAKKSAELYIEKLQQSCPVEISLNDDLTEEHSIGFVFFYNSSVFWKTGDFMDALAGNCPILIKKCDGSLVTLSTSQSIQKSLGELALSET